MRKHLQISTAVVLLALASLTTFFLFQQDTALSKAYLLPTAIGDNTESLQAYWLSTKHNPILALPSTDLEALSLSVDSIEQIQNIIVPFYKESEQQMLYDSWRPLSFLKRLAETEKERRAFLENPNPESLLSYHQQLLISLNTYVSDINKLIAALESFDNKTYATFSGLSSHSFTITQLKQAAGVATMKQTEASERFGCYQNGDLACLKSHIKPDLSDWTLKSVEVATLSSDQKKIVGFYTKLKNLSATTTAHLVVLDEPNCFLFTKESVPYLSINDLSRFQDLPYTMNHPVSDVHFFDHQALSEFTYFANLYEVGVDYSIHYPTPYMCPEYSYDDNAIYITNTIYETLSNEPFGFPSTEEFSQIKQAQDAILDDSMLRHHAKAENFIAALASLYSKNTEVELVAQLGELPYQRLFTMLLQSRSRDGFLVEELHLLTDMGVGSYLLLEQQPSPVEQLYVTKSYASTFYLFDNQTLFQNRLSLTERPGFIPYEEFNMLSYLDTVQFLRSDEELIDANHKMTEFRLASFKKAAVQ